MPSNYQPDIPAGAIIAERFRLLRRRLRAEWLQTRASNLPFPASAGKRLLLVSLPERIPQSQIFPFHYFASSLRKQHDVAVREVSLRQVLSGSTLRASNATTVAFQTAFDITDPDLHKLYSKLIRANPDARMVYLDWTAPADLRNAERLDPLIDIYVKKHVLSDRRKYGLPTLGDTNLSDFYIRRLNLTESTSRFPLPAGFLDKLLVGPSFVTAPTMLPDFLSPPCFRAERDIDLHARFATDGTLWYEAMRQEAADALESVADLKTVIDTGVPLYSFITELRRSKACFSPFGYGEVCWRDFEAVMAGAVLIKPDTSHIETRPDIFVPWETYVPVRWDLADFATSVRKIVNDDSTRQRISEAAFTVLLEYLAAETFTGDMGPLFT